jgi:cytochrome P450
MRKQILILITLFILCFILFKNDLIINSIVFLTLKRGIVSTNCFWWKINNYFPDVTGYYVYQRIKNKNRFVKINIAGKTFYLITNLNDIKELLQLSPNPFGPGLLKKNFFDSFMPKNVGISINPDWKYRREYNDKVLQTDKFHELNVIFYEHIFEAYSTMKYKKFDDILQLTRKLTSKIIFGTYDYNKSIYKVFNQTNSLILALFKVNPVNKKDLDNFHNYCLLELENPKPNTLLSLAKKYHKIIPIEQILDQIPHWIFPIAGLFSVQLPRLLVILESHPNELRIVIDEIKLKSHFNKNSFVRKCILELFRCNNPVNSTFRSLLSPFKFENSDITFEKDSQFVFFNNPLLRDLFEFPNNFVPNRWNEELENSIRALMFNQGPQRCPGKELTISLMIIALEVFLKLNNYEIKSNTKIDPNFIPFMINPCNIEFY